MVEKIVPLDSPPWVWGDKGPEELLALVGSWWVIWDEEVVAGSRRYLTLEVRDVGCVPRRLPENHLVKADSHRPQISFIGVTDISPGIEQFRCHRDWRAQLRGCHLRATFGEAEVSDDDLVIIEENICQLKVSMHNLVFVKFLESVHYLFEEVHTLLLSKALIFLHVVLQISVVAVVDDQVIVVSGLEVLIEMEDVRVLDLAHHSHLCVEELSQLRIFIYLGFIDGFDGVDFVGGLVGCFVHYAKLALSQFRDEQVVANLFHFLEKNSEI